MWCVCWEPPLAERSAHYPHARFGHQLRLRCAEPHTLIRATCSQLHDDTVRDSGLTDVQKALICEELASVDSKLGEGADEMLQLRDLAASMQRVIRGKELMTQRRSH